jgi:hypothetical protein
VAGAQKSQIFSYFNGRGAQKVSRKWKNCLYVKTPKSRNGFFHSSFTMLSVCEMPHARDSISLARNKSLTMEVVTNWITCIWNEASLWNGVTCSDVWHKGEEIPDTIVCWNNVEDANVDYEEDLVLELEEGGMLNRSADVEALDYRSGNHDSLSHSTSFDGSSYEQTNEHLWMQQSWDESR